MAQFNRELARLLLEICRFTYDAGVGDLNGVKEGDRRQRPKEYIDSHHAPLGIPTGPPITIKGSETSFACMVPYPLVNVVSYMGTITEFQISPSDVGFVHLRELHELIQQGHAIDNFLHAPAIAKKLNELKISLKDWGEDGKARLVPFKINGQVLEGQVHHGFLNELTAVHQQIIAQLKMHGDVVRPLILTGHSQGAAEAAMAIQALAAAGFTVQEAYTFAAPRSGNAAYVQLIQKLKTPVHRIEFGDDIVPHLPPASIRTFLGAMLQENEKILQHVGPLLDRFHDVGYLPVGSLCYGHPDERRLQLDFTAAEESALFQNRLKQLSKAEPKNLGEHHHLAGTTAEFNEGTDGNYTVLVSPDGWEIGSR